MARYGYHGSHEDFEVGTGRSHAHVPGADATLGLGLRAPVRR